MAVLLLLWVAFGGLGWWVAAQKGRPEVEGLILGFAFGPIGCVIEALMPTPAEPTKTSLGGSVVAGLKKIDDAINQAGAKPPKREGSSVADAPFVPPKPPRRP